MSTLPVCRVCLAVNSRMHIISNTRLQTTYEALSGKKLLTKDGKPESVCYICYGRLRSCWKLQEMSQKAEEFLTQLLRNGIRLAEENIKMLDGKIEPALSTTKHASKTEYYNMVIKEEITGLKEMPVKIPMEGSMKIDRKAEIPIQFNVSVETISLKQEINSSEFDEDFDTTCIAMNQNNESETKVTNKGQTIVTATIKTLTKHSSGGKIYSCDICSRLFKQAAYLQRHKKTHIPKLFSCLRCHETFSTESDLQTHILKHTQLNLLVCDLCSKAFLSKNSLENHMARKHMRTHSSKKIHACDRCNKTFNHRGTLRLHMRIHTGDKPYACEHCPKTFSQKGTLKRHIRMHTGEKPYACDRCTKTFNQESSLKRHIKMHTGEKQYACNRCGKAYYESSHLTRHMRTHTGEKPYACDRCFQTFAQSSNLQAHMKKHTGEKASNYICHECNKTFDHKSIFKRHLLIHTREKPYPCDQCDKKYADKRTLHRHITQTHNQSLKNNFC